MFHSLKRTVKVEKSGMGAVYVLQFRVESPDSKVVDEIVDALHIAMAPKVEVEEKERMLGFHAEENDEDA